MSLLEFLEILDVQLWIFCFQNIFLNGEFFTWPNITLGPYSKPLSSYNMPLVRLESAYACHLEGALVEPPHQPCKKQAFDPPEGFPTGKACYHDHVQEGSPKSRSPIPCPFTQRRKEVLSSHLVSFYSSAKSSRQK